MNASTTGPDTRQKLTQARKIVGTNEAHGEICIPTQVIDSHVTRVGSYALTGSDEPMVLLLGRETHTEPK